MFHASSIYWANKQGFLGENLLNSWSLQSLCAEHNHQLVLYDWLPNIHNIQLRTCIHILYFIPATARDLITINDSQWYTSILHKQPTLLPPYYTLVLFIFFLCAPSTRSILPFSYFVIFFPYTIFFISALTKFPVIYTRPIYGGIITKLYLYAMVAAAAVA